MQSKELFGNQRSMWNFGYCFNSVDNLEISTSLSARDVQLSFGEISARVDFTHFGWLRVYG